MDVQVRLFNKSKKNNIYFFKKNRDCNDFKIGKLSILIIVGSI
jgi:hypothetical protein